MRSAILSLFRRLKFMQFIARFTSRPDKLFDQVISTSPSIISIIDLLGQRHIYLNDKANQVFGYPMLELRTLNLVQTHELIHPADRGGFKDLINVVKNFSEDKFLTYECRILKKDQFYAWIRIRCSPFERDEHGKVTKILSNSEDITHEKELQDQLQAAHIRSLSGEKLAALGEMAGGMAHEINNPLAIILGHTQALRSKIQRGVLKNEDIIHSIEKIESTSKRISKVVNSLRMVASDGLNDQFIDVGMETIFDDLESFWGQKLLNQGIKFEVSYHGSNPTAHCRPVQIVLILLNLIGNSFQAVQDLDEKWIQIEASEDEHFVNIRITDSGPGIPADIRDKLFNPFFTTKPVGQGAGLGLSVARGIAKVHNGELLLDTNRANTSFILRIPRPAAATQDRAA